MRTHDAARVRKIPTERGLVSCMNDTKWREVCDAFRHWPKPPRFRLHDVLTANGYVFGWDRDWDYHPLPYVGIQWLEVELGDEEVAAGVESCRRAGAACERSPAGLRIWGWVGPADRSQFV